MSTYTPPQRRRKTPKRPQTTPVTVQTVKLPENEVLLLDGRILIRGTLRKDGTRRPDRYKRAGFLNDEDLQRNKYIPKPAQERMNAKKKEEQSEIEKRNTEKQNRIRYVESLVFDVIHNPPKQVDTDNNGMNKLNIDFKQNVLMPLLNEFYEENELLLRKDITKWFTNNMNKCQQLMDNDLLRTEIIRFIHKLLFNKRNQTKERLKRNHNNTVIRGRGNFAFGTANMLSQNIEKETKGNNKTRRHKVRKLNQKYKEIKQLEQRQLNGHTLNEQQKDKIQSKHDVLAKLTDLKITSLSQ